MAKTGGYAARLGVDMSGGNTFVTVGQIRDIDAPGIGRESINVTTRDSTDGNEELKGLKKGGEMVFEVLFDPDMTSHAYASGLLSDIYADVTPNWVITLPDTSPETTFTFNGWLSAFEIVNGMEDAVIASVTVTVTGEIRFDVWYFDSGKFFDAGLLFK